MADLPIELIPIDILEHTALSDGSDFADMI